MNNSLKYLGVVLILLGVVCLIVYKYALPSNGLLIAAMVLELEESWGISLSIKSSNNAWRPRADLMMR